MKQRNQRVGIIPYIIEGEVVKMAFMIPSDAAYGGAEPQIAKGRIDGLEFPLTAAIREGKEELGLREENMLERPWVLNEQIVHGMNATYPLRVYGVRVRSKEDFDVPGYETSHVVWMSAIEFYAHGRKEHADLVIDMPTAVVLERK